METQETAPISARRLGFERRTLDAGAAACGGWEGDMDFKGKAVLVTGSSRGIGIAVAKAFHDLGACVAVNGTTDEGVVRVIEELGGGEGLVAAPGDVRTAAGCAAVVGTALSALGGLDVLVNNAGIYRDGPMLDADEAMWDEVVDTNLKGVFFCSQAALPSLRVRRGNIVNVSSECGLQGFAGATVHCASKGAVVNLTRAMALEVAPEVRVNCICPGTVATDTRFPRCTRAEREALYAELSADYPLQRVGETTDVAHTITYLASDKAGFVTGATWAMEGGSTSGRTV